MLISHCKRKSLSERYSKLQCILQDWDFLVNSDHNEFMNATMESSLGLSHASSLPDATSYSKPCGINTSAQLFAHIPSIFMALHLVYEVS